MSEEARYRQQAQAARDRAGIRAAVRHLVHHDQMMLGLDSDLHVVADNTRAAAARRHRTTVGIGQRDLLVGEATICFSQAASLLICSFSFASFSLSRVAFAANASVGSCRSAVSSWLR